MNLLIVVFGFWFFFALPNFVEIFHFFFKKKSNFKNVKTLSVNKKTQTNFDMIANT